MTCYHPLRAVCIGETDKGKRRLKILNKADPEYNIAGIDYMSIPCGHCIGCKLEYSKQWADRCMLEAMYHDRNSFITLTYDDEHLPNGNYIYDDDGVVVGISPIHPLRKKDFQNFMKRLREHFDDRKIRFFAAGEYGTSSFRPHYHAIIFGEDFSDDRSFLKRNNRNEPYYISDTLFKLWPYGFHTICDVTWNTCNYVARYCLKKINGNESEIYKSLNYPKEFTLMSRRPGIAKQYFEDHKDKIYKNEEIFLALPDKSLRIKPSRYYDKLYDITNPSDMDLIRSRRKLSSDVRRELKSELSSNKYLVMLKSEEYNLKKKTAIFNERRCE